MNQLLPLLLLGGGTALGNLFGTSSTGGISSLLPLMLMGGSGGSLTKTIMGFMIGQQMGNPLLGLAATGGLGGSSKTYTRASVRAAYYKGLSRRSYYRRY